MLERVGLPREAVDRYPSQFSGGQRQRIAVARALICEPKLVVCDEAVSALDLSTQAQVLNLLADLRDERGLSYLFIAHDISVVQFLAQRVVVLYRGQVMESGPAAAVTESPQHPFTQALVAASPVPRPGRTGRAAETARIPWRPDGGCSGGVAGGLSVQPAVPARHGTLRLPASGPPPGGRRRRRLPLRLTPARSPTSGSFPRMNHPTHLRTDHVSEAFGITNTLPKFSWTPPRGTVRQTAYQLTANNGWDTGRVDSGAHLFVPYTGPSLGSRDRFEWKVRTWNTGADGIETESGWSEADGRGTGPPAPRRLDRPVDRSRRAGDPGAGGAPRLCAAPGIHPGIRTGIRAGVCHRPRDLRVLHQRAAGGGPTAHPRLHELPQHPAGPDVRRRRPAARRIQQRAGGPHGRLVPGILRFHPRRRHVRDADGLPGAAGD